MQEFNCVYRGYSLCVWREDDGRIGLKTNDGATAHGYYIAGSFRLPKGIQIGDSFLTTIQLDQNEQLKLRGL